MIIRAAVALVGVTLFAHTSSDMRRQEISTLAASLLQQTDLARQAIAHHDQRAAQEAIRQAQDLTRKIETTAGTRNQPLVVTVSSQLDKEATMVPARKRNASISEVRGTLTATLLNVTNARLKLESASQALQAGDFNAADMDLAAVQAGAVTKTYTGDMPVMQARENLSIARSRVQQGDYKDAILPLKSAASALDRFAQQVPKPQQAELAEKMKLDIDAYAERITHDHTDALDRVNGWYDQVDDWFTTALVP